MNLKGFLKPTKWKILLWIAVFLVSPAYFTDLLCPAVIGTDCSPNQIIPLMGGGATLAGIARNIGVGISLFSNISVPFFALSVAISYIVSCAIAFFCSAKIKKPKTANT